MNLKCVFLNSSQIGHFNPTLELISILAKNSVEVHCFVPVALRTKVENAGALFHNYGVDDWDMKNCAIEQVKILGYEPNYDILNGSLSQQALPATLSVLDYVLSELKSLQPSFCVSDSSFPWSFIACKLLNIPCISSCSSTLMSLQDRQVHFGYLHQIDFIQECVNQLKFKYCIDYDPTDVYCNYTDFTIVWTIPRFLSDINEECKNPCIHYFGASVLLITEPIRIDELGEIHASYNLIENQKYIDQTAIPSSLAYISYGRENLQAVDDDLPWSLLYSLKALSSKSILYLSMGTVVGSDGIFPNPKSVFQNTITAVNQIKKDFILIISMGTIEYNAESFIVNSDINSNNCILFIRRNVNQKQLLPIVDIFISHCGMNSTNEALVYGCPMLCVPVFGDQNSNAENIARLGCGIHIRSPFAPALCPHLNHLTTEVIKAALEELFGRFREISANCKSIRREMLERLSYLHTQAAKDIIQWVESFSSNSNTY